MKIISFKIIKPFCIEGIELKAENKCPCGCSPHPFVLISDGKKGMTAEFRSEEELNKFKKQVKGLIWE